MFCYRLTSFHRERNRSFRRNNHGNGRREEKSSRAVNVGAVFPWKSASFLQQRPFLSFSWWPQLDERQQKLVMVECSIECATVQQIILEFPAIGCERCDVRSSNEFKCSTPRVTQLGVKLSHKILGGQELSLLSPVFLHGSILEQCRSRDRTTLPKILDWSTILTCFLDWALHFSLTEKAHHPLTHVHARMLGDASNPILLFGRIVCCRYHITGFSNPFQDLIGAFLIFSSQF